uniref:microfibrillar-associated protein 2-like n=1 Tax=Pristiophorus japonicus TaxID=55135 RepID=UPI00398E8092
MLGSTVCIVALSLSASLLVAVVAQDTGLSYGDTPDTDYTEYTDPPLYGPQPTDSVPLLDECREEQYPCTRLYSVNHPLKQCVHTLCFYSLRRMYIVNKEICIRTVCLQEEKIKEDLCRAQQGWPHRFRRNNRRRNRVYCNDVLP